MSQHARVIATAVVAVLLGTAAAPAAVPGWATFAHPQLGFSLSYPRDWTETKGITGVAFMVVGPASVGGAAPRLNVNVTSDELPARMTAEQYDAQAESGLGMLFHGYRRLRRDVTMLGAFPAIIRYYTWKRNDGVELYQMQLVTVVGTRGYVVTGTTSTSSARLADETSLLASILMTFQPQ
jgi:hypothetical protein